MTYCTSSHTKPNRREITTNRREGKQRQIEAKGRHATSKRREVTPVLTHLNGLWVDKTPQHVALKVRELRQTSAQANDPRCTRGPSTDTVDTREEVLWAVWIGGWIEGDIAFDKNGSVVVSAGGLRAAREQTTKFSAMGAHG
jgi:hypothetical protein